MPEHRPLGRVIGRAPPAGVDDDAREIPLSALCLLALVVGVVTGFGA